MSTLQELLNLGLVDIGSDDSRFDKMQSASTALSAKFKEKPSLLIPATLLSLDEDIDEDDPMFGVVEELVVTEWKTLRNTHVNRPRELLRSIIIDALAATVDGDHNLAGILWNSAACPLRYRQVRPGKAEAIIKELVVRACELAEQEAVARSELIARAQNKRKGKKSSPIKKLKLDISAVITDQDVFEDVARSAGPQHPQNPDLETPNPHWPNQGQPWATEFTTRMATALSNAVNLGNARISESLSDQIAGYLSEFENQLAEQVRKAKKLQSEILQIHESSRMRLDVLWWSDALYSTVLQVGYSELDIPVAAIAAAVDLANIVPPLSPASVCYVLGEVMNRLSQIKAGNNEMAVQAYLEAISKAEMELGDHLPAPQDGDGRLPLVDLVGESVAGSSVAPETIRNSAGVDPSLVLSPAEFAIWVFRGIQARRLVEELQ